MSWIRPYLLKLAQSMARTPMEATSLGSDRSHYIRLGLALTLILPGVGLIVWAYVSEIHSWGVDAQPTIPVGRSEWRVLLREENASEGCHRSKENSRCVASSASGPLFQSKLSRMSPEAKEAIVRGTASTFWMGAEISPEKLHTAAVDGANQLVLGYILGSWELWIDGRFYSASTFAEGRMPIRVSIPMQRLHQKNPMRIAIKIVNEGNSVRPDKFNFQNIQSGLSTPANSERAMLAMTYMRGGQNHLFLGVYSAFTFILLGFWMLTRKKMEYLALSLVAFIGMLRSCLDVEFISSHFRLDQILHFRLALITLTAGSVVYLGAAFARLNRKSLLFSLAIFFCATLGYYSKSLSPAGLIQSINSGSNWLLGGSFLVAALLAVSQFLALKASAASAPSRLRMSTLAHFVILASGTGSWILLERHLVGGEYFRYQIYALIALSYFTWLILKEYRLQERQLIANPVSKYHRSLQLPEKISGVVVCFDLKGSEKLFSASIPGMAPGEIVHLAISHIWGAAQERGGVVLSTAGDSIQVFFEQGDTTKAAIAAIEQASTRMNALTEQFRTLAPLPEIQFRAAISIGSIRPVWAEVGGEKKAEWRDATEHLLFLEQARLLEAEKSLANLSDGSSIVCLAPNRPVLEPALGAPQAANSVVIKHDQKWEVCGWQLSRARPHLQLVA